MRVSVARKKAGDVKADLKVLPVAEGKENGGGVAELKGDEAAAVARRVKTTEFKAKAGHVLSVQTGAADLLLVGLGKGKNAEAYRRAAAKGVTAAAAVKARNVAVCLGPGAAAKKQVEPVIEGFRLAAYRFDKYKSDEKERKKFRVTSLVIAGVGLTADVDAKQTIAHSEAVIDSVYLARDLINEMSSVKTPSYLVRTAKRIAKGGGLSCEVWQGKKLEKENMNGILAVSAGSAEPGAFVRLIYKPKSKPRATIAVVGKGITFDSGGLSLKPAKAMEWMKQDMSGAATVLAVMKSVAALQPRAEVRGYIASAENMPGQGAQKPGDVITYRNGKTAEVLNTDAEGRLVLADALCVASEDNPDCIIDLATLTGACMVALGTRIAGVLGNDQKLIDSLIEHGEANGERLWQLPLPDDYKRDIESATADIQNIGSGYGGTITAALFLEAFVGRTPWAHLDIAGPAFAEKSMPYAPRGGTGFGIRSLVSYIESF